MAEGELREIAVIKRDQVTQGESSGAMTRLGAISADSVGSEGLFMGVSRLPPGQRIDFVSIVTPNVSHFDIAATFLNQGFHVVCDKPMTFTLAMWTWS